MDYQLISPTNGEPLRPAGEQFLTDGERLWPIVDGIPFLRPDEELRKKVVTDLHGWGERAALCRLLANQDRFSPTAPPEKAAIERLLEADDMTLREAMDLLNYGPVGDYFAYRWCSPTFTGGLNMLERTPAQHTVIEIACGIGHFLRALEGAGRETVGVDIVFSKLWLAKKFLGIQGDLICGDIEAGQLISTAHSTTVFCHDAFYFFEHKQAALTHMRSIAAGGAVAVGHVHTKRSQHEAGFALDKASYDALTDAFIRDDNDYITAWYETHRPPGHGASVAVGWIEGEVARRPIDWVRPRMRLRQNPLVDAREVRWPSEGWAEEYREDSACLNGHSLPSLVKTPAPADRYEQFRQRRLLNLPPQW